MPNKESHQGKSRLERALKLGRKLATAADVAALAGVSASAVSRTFTDGASVSKTTREKVVAAAKTLKYRPNQIARSLMTNRSHIIGVAVTHIDNQFYPEVLEALSEALRNMGYRILLFVTHGSMDFDPALDELLKFRVDALILASTSLSSTLAEECRDVGVPVIMLNNTDTSSSIASVSGQNYEGAATMAQFLVAGEHRQFAFLAGTADSSTNQLREAGFNAYLAGQGLSKPVRAVGNFQFDQAMVATRELLGLPKRPDALFCANDHMALAAIQVARSEFGLHVGKDISIVGFDDLKLSAWPAFQLTTFSQPVKPIIDTTISLLKRMLEGKSDSMEHETVAGNLIIRTSARVPAPQNWPPTHRVDLGPGANSFTS